MVTGIYFRGLFSIQKLCPISLIKIGRDRRFRVKRQFSLITNLLQESKEKVNVTFVFPDGEKAQAKAKVGDNLLDIVIENNVDIDGFGACEGTLACSTCHLIFKPEDFNRLPDEATDEELDMLDLAYSLTDTSRLGCQVCMTKELNGIEVKVPAGIIDQR